MVGTQLEREVAEAVCPGVYDPQLGVHVHEAADAFAMIEEDEFAQLKQNIEHNGLLEPVVMFQGAILDGRNRWRACRELGIEPEVVEWRPTGPLDSPEGFVVAKNIMRRHISKSQRAAHAARLYGMLLSHRVEDAGQTSASAIFSHLAATESEPSGNGPSKSLREDVAETLGVSAPYLGDAYSLLRADPSRFELVERGKLSLQSALNQHCAEHHRRGTLFSDSTIREGVKRRWLNSRPGLGVEKKGGDQDGKPASSPGRKPRRSTLSDVHEDLTPQKIAALLRKERESQGLKRSMVPVTLEVTFANGDVYEEYHKALLKDDRVLRVRATNHLARPPVAEDSALTEGDPGDGCP